MFKQQLDKRDCCCLQVESQYGLCGKIAADWPIDLQRSSRPGRHHGGKPTRRTAARTLPAGLAVPLAYSRRFCKPSSCDDRALVCLFVMRDTIEVVHNRFTYCSTPALALDHPLFAILGLHNNIESVVVCNSGAPCPTVSHTHNTHGLVVLPGHEMIVAARAICSPNAQPEISPTPLASLSRRFPTSSNGLWV
jgi:hypothetical protein